MTLPDRDSLATLGGIKRNYYPVEDPTVDVDADQENVAKADIAMMTRVGERAWCSFTTDATTPVLVDHDSQWGSAIGVAPTIARTATGTFTATWPASVVDELSVSHTLNLRSARAGSRSATVAHTVQAVRTAANVVTVYLFAGGALSDEAGTVLDVWGY